MNAFELKVQGLKCDSPSCDFEDVSIKVEDYHKWVDASCPKCGSNLLTKSDYDRVQKMIAFTQKMNQIFPKRKQGEPVIKGSAHMNGTGKVDVKIEGIGVDLDGRNKDN